MFNKLYSKILERLDRHIIIITDTDSKIIFVNEHFTEITKYTKEEAIGAKPSILKSGKMEKSFYEEMWKTILSGETWKADIINKTKDGDEFIAEQTIYPFYEDEEIKYFIGVQENVTKQREDERIIKYQNLFLNNVLKNIEAGILVMNNNGEFVYSNRKSNEILGIVELKNHMFDDPIWNVRDLYDNKISIKNLLFNRVFKDNEIIKNEDYKIKNLKNEEKIIRISSSRLDYNGVFEVVFSIIDKTEEINQRNLSEKNRKKYELMFKNNKTPILVIDPKTGEILDSNKAAADFYEYSIDEIKKIKIYDINTLDEQDIKENMQEVLYEGSNYFNFSHKTKTGKIKDVEIYSNKTDINGKIILYNSIYDKTEKNLAIRQKNDILNQLEGVIQALPGYLVVFDKKYQTILSSNREEFNPDLYKEIRDYNIKFEKKILHHYNISINGEYFIIYEYGIFDKNEIKYIVKYAIDVTDLYIAKQEAEEASRAKDYFIASMSHEIKTPLNGLLGMLELLEDTKLDDNQRKIVEMAQGAGNILFSILNDILDFSKLEMGKLKYNPIEIDIKKIVEDVIHSFQYSARKKGIKIYNEITESKIIKTDDSKLRQIFFNIIGNAVKFTDEGHVRIFLEENDNSICFSIEDTGIGIPKEKHDEIFKSFFQIENNIKQKKPGSGLGLSISKKLAQLLGGDIIIESEEGKGTTFTICIKKQLD